MEAGKPPYESISPIMDAFGRVFIYEWMRGAECGRLDGQMRRKTSARATPEYFYMLKVYYLILLTI